MSEYYVSLVGMTHEARYEAIEVPRYEYKVGLPTAQASAQANIKDQSRLARTSSDAVQPRGELYSCVALCSLRVYSTRVPGPYRSGDVGQQMNAALRVLP